MDNSLRTAIKAVTVFAGSVVLVMLVMACVNLAIDYNEQLKEQTAQAEELLQTEIAAILADETLTDEEKAKKLLERQHAAESKAEARGKRYAGNYKANEIGRIR